jgi:hypothetical protein
MARFSRGGYSPVNVTAALTESEDMTVQRPHPTAYEYTLEAVSECLQNITDLTNGLPLGDLIDYACKNGFPQMTIDGLDKLGAAACVLVNSGPEAVWDFVADAGTTRRTNDDR